MEEGVKTTLIQFNSMIIARKSYSYLKQIEKTPLGEQKITCNPIRTYNFAVRNEVTSSNTSWKLQNLKDSQTGSPSNKNKNK